MRIQFCLLATTMTITGCAADNGNGNGNDNNDLDTAETVSAISVAGGATWHGTSPTPLGPINQQTCWLDGLGGQFLGQPFEAQLPNGGDQQPIPAEVRVFPNAKTGLWELDTDSGIGSGVGARVICVNVPWTSNKVHEFSWSDNLTTTGYIGNLSTRCFLRDVWATTGLDSYLAPFTPNIAISRHVNGTTASWDFGNSYVHNYAGDQEFGGGTAVCIDGTWTGGWSYTFVGARSDVLRNSYPSGARVPIANVACGITGVHGDWSGAAGWNTGAFLDNDPAHTQFWKIDVATGRTVDVSCVE